MFHILFSLLRAKYIFFWCYQNVWFEAKNVLVERDYVISREINTVLKIAVFGKSCWNVDTRKMLRSVLKRYFFGFIEALPSKGILNAIKKNELHQPWSALTLQLSLWLRDKWDRSLCKFISPDATVMNVFAILRVVLMDLGIWSEFFRCVFKAS